MIPSLSLREFELVDAILLAGRHDRLDGLLGQVGLESVLRDHDTKLGRVPRVSRDVALLVDNGRRSFRRSSRLRVLLSDPEAGTRQTSVEDKT